MARCTRTGGALLPPLVYLATATLLARAALTAPRLPGQPMGEAWGHLFAMRQAARWLLGEDRPAASGILSLGEGAFWPVNPLTSFLGALLDLLLGATPRADGLAISSVLILLLALAGLGACHLARMLGAPPLPSLVAGLALQLHPFLLRNAGDTNLEVAAIGLAAIAAATLLRAVRDPKPRALALVAAASLACAATAPYWAVYLVLLALPWLLWRARTEGVGRMARVGLALLVGCAIPALPLLAVESGPNGRLGPSYTESGFHPAPTELGLLGEDGVFMPLERRGARASASRAGMSPPALGTDTRGEAGESAAQAACATLSDDAEIGHRPEPRPPPSKLVRFLLRFPGGLSCAALLAVGFLSRRSRGLATLALLLLLLGVGPMLLARAIDPLSRFDIVPLQILLQKLPLLGSLGNPQRLVMLYALPAIAAGALTLGEGRLRALALALLVSAEALLALPRLALPATPLDAPDARQVTGLSLTGPVSIFPLGDPPIWNGGAPPKRALYLAAHLGWASTSDYGRGGLPADLPLLLGLSAASGVSVARDALMGLEGRLPDASLALASLRTAGVRTLLLDATALPEGTATRACEAASTLLGPPSSSSGNVWLWPVGETP